MHGKPKYPPDYKYFDYVNPAAPKGGVLRQSAIGTFDSLNPFPIKGKAAFGLGLVHDKLMERAWNEPFTLYPLIAQSADIPQDRSSITFTLDPRATFQDGSPITTDDILFSFETLRDFGRPNMRRVYKIVSRVDILSQRKIRFNLGPDRNRETVMILAIMPVLSKNWWQGRVFDETTLTIPVASGPYKILSVNPGRRIIYERVKNHWAQNLPPRIGHHNFDQIIVDYFRDETVALEAFKNGSINFRREYDPTKWVRDYDFQNTKSGQIVKHSIAHRRPERAIGFIFNTRRAPFDSIEVRRALSLMLDFEWINKNIYFSLTRQINSVFPNSDLAEGSFTLPKTGTSDLLRQNLMQADRLLQNAGWIIKDGIRTHLKTGKVFSFEILTSQPEDEKIAIAYKRSLKRLGIQANIRTLDQANYRDRMNNYDFDLTVNYWLSSLSPGTEQILYWGCQAAKEPGRFNYSGICDSGIDKLSADLANVETRNDLLKTAHLLDSALMKQFIFIPFGYTGVDFIAADSSLKSPENVPLYGTVLETWWDKRAQIPLSGPAKP